MAKKKKETVVEEPMVEETVVMEQPVVETAKVETKRKEPTNKIIDGWEIKDRMYFLADNKSPLT